MNTNMRILNYKDFLILESKGFKYGIVMCKFETDFWSNILNEIDDDDIYKENGYVGKEKNPHVTILYGIHENEKNEDIKACFKNIKAINANITDISIFENEDFDVLKFGIDSNELNILHYWMKDKLDYTSSFDEYEGHATIAYLKKGTVDKYINILTDKYLPDNDSREIVLDKIIINSAKGKKNIITLK